MVRALWLAAAVVAVLASAPALIKVVGVGGWWWVGVGCAAAVTGVWAKLLEDRLKRRDHYREDTARNLRHGTVGGGLLSVRDITAPVVVGARRTRDHDAGPVPYVWREAHPSVVGLCVPGNFVLVVGDPLSGKTRLAYEALREALPDARFVAPEHREILDAAITAAAAGRGVLWLDDLDRFLGPDGLTVAAIMRMAPGVIVATIRRDKLAVLLEGESRRVLDLARQVPVERSLTVAEEHAAPEHPGIDDALAHADECGFAEFLAAQPALFDEWTSAWSPGSHPRAAALMAAAADLVRAEMGPYVLKELVLAIHESYLAERGGDRLRPERLEEAWRWLTEPRGATVSFLRTIDGDHVHPFGPLVDQIRPPAHRRQAKVRVSRAMESAAVRVTYRYPLLFPIPVQSWSYCREIFEPGATEDRPRMGYTFDEAVAHRAAVLEPGGPSLTVVVSEGVFRTRIGDSRTMAEQFAHLRELAGSPGVDVRVILYDVGAFPFMEAGNFALIEFENALPVVRYTTLFGDRFLTDIEEADAAMWVAENLDPWTLSAADSLAFLEQQHVAVLAEA